MKSIEQKVIRFISENNLLSKGDKILVTLSGGPDSVFLLHFLNKFKKKYNIEVGAVHINHLLRGNNSERDELFCRAICDELSLSIFVFKKDIKTFAKKNKISLELAGRKIRYNYFEKIATKYSYNKIATAHNTDDNAETVFLNLIKGSGIKGISGIPVKRENIIRPILSLTKKEILEYLEENQFEYRNDDSNLSNDFERNYLRNEVLPLIQKKLNPAVSSTILNSSLTLQNLNTGLENIANKFATDIKAIKNKSVSVSNDLFRDENNFIIPYFLKQTIENNFSVRLESSDVKKILTLKNSQTGKSEQLSCKLLAMRERNKISIKKSSSAYKKVNAKIKIGENIKLGAKKLFILVVERNKIRFNKSKNIEYISADGIKNNFTIRNWQKGDKFFPIGMKGSKKISDYLNNIKVNSFEKHNQLVLENSGKIIWVIGKRLDDRFKITQETRKVLKLCLR